MMKTRDESVVHSNRAKRVKKAQNVFRSDFSQILRFLWRLVLSRSLISLVLTACWHYINKTVAFKLNVVSCMQHHPASKDLPGPNRAPFGSCRTGKYPGTLNRYHSFLDCCGPKPTCRLHKPCCSTAHSRATHCAAWCTSWCRSRSAVWSV